MKIKIEKIKIFIKSIVGMFRKKRYYFLVVFVLILAWFRFGITLRKTDNQIKKIFSDKNQKIQIIHDTILNHSIRYLVTHDSNKNLPLILFVHGAPGSSTDFLKYMQDTTLRKKAILVSVDRLGYGFSEFGKAEPSIKKQAEVLNSLIKKYQANRVILVGWSYGGPIVAKMAMDNSKINQIVLLAPAVSPKNEKYFWIGNLAKWKLTKWLVPIPFVVAETEKIAHKKELDKLNKEWSKLKTPILNFHGDNDFLVPYENTTYLKTKVDSSLLKTISLKGRNHFIPFTEFKRIKADLIKILDDSK